MAIEVGNRSGLAEMFDAERAGAVTMDRAEPAERRGMRIAHRDDAAVRRHLRHQPFDMRARMYQPALARPLRGRPASVEAISGSHRKQTYVAPVFAHQPDRLDRLRRDRAGVSHDHLAVRSRFAHPVGAVDDRLPQLRHDGALDLLDRTRGEAEIPRSASLVAQPVAFGGRALAILLDVVERSRHDGGKLVHVGWLER